jgi:hypothetical protein
MEEERKRKGKRGRLWTDVDCGGRLVVVMVVVTMVVVVVLVLVELVLLELADAEEVVEKDEVLT